MSGGPLPGSYQTDASPPIDMSERGPSSPSSSSPSSPGGESMPSPHAFSSSAVGRVQQHFSEPTRHVAETSAAPTPALWGLPPRLVRIFFRIRNTLSVYNFFTIYCFNALLNTEIYREYMSLDEEGSGSAGGKPPSQGRLPTQRTMLENLYIMTLMAPLGDVLIRITARNFFKLNLAKSMSHASFTSSLAMCTPSLNAYGLLLLRGSGWAVVSVLVLDIGEVVYSLIMWQLQPIKTEALYIKLAFIVFTMAMFAWDVVVLVQMRRFFKKLPPHLNAVYVCWDANSQFHWSSANSLLDIMVEHENVRGDKFVSVEGRKTRRRIAEWNQDEQLQALAHVAPGDNVDDEHDGQQHGHGHGQGLGADAPHLHNGLANGHANGHDGTHSGTVSEEEEEQEHKSLLSSRR